MGGFNNEIPLLLSSLYLSNDGETAPANLIDPLLVIHMGEFFLPPHVSFHETFFFLAKTFFSRAFAPGRKIFFFVKKIFS